MKNKIICVVVAIVLWTGCAWVATELGDFFASMLG